MWEPIKDKLWHQWLRRPYRLNFQTYGSGDEPLLLLHGLASSHVVWRQFVAHVRKDWQIIAPDLLGFGASPTPEWNSYDIEQHTKHVVALLGRFRIDQPITIVAHSMGCLIASHIAATQPQLVKQVILYEPPLFADVPGQRFHSRFRKGYFALFRYIAAHPELVFKNGELRKMYSNITGISLRPDTWIPFQRSIKNTIMEQAAYDELNAIKVPTLIVYGRLDFVAPEARVTRMLNANPMITFRTVNRTHGLSRAGSAELARFVTDFTARGRGSTE